MYSTKRLQGLGVEPSWLIVTLELPTNNAVRAAAIAAKAAAGLSHLVVQDASALGTLLHIPVALPERDFFIVQQRKGPLQKPEAFVD